MLILGGALGAVDIFELAIIPMLIHNCDTWYKIDENDMNELENLQNLFLNILFQVPSSTPKSAGVWETGTLLMQNRISERKLKLGKYLQQQDKSELSYQIYEEQINNNYPGLAKECVILAKECDVVDDYEDESVSKKKFNSLFKNKIKMKNEKQLKDKMKDMTKLKHLIEEPFECKEYLKILNLEQIRTKFKIRTKMIKTKLNMKNIDKNWMCDSCETAIDSQSHVIWCPAYSQLREGKNLDSDKDLIDYFNKVLAIRAELHLIK